MQAATSPSRGLGSVLGLPLRPRGYPHFRLEFSPHGSQSEQDTLCKLEADKDSL